MADLEWEPSWSVGNDVLDRDHKTLVKIINRIVDKQINQESADWLLRLLSEYADHHFDREEKMMQLAGFEELEPHKKEHQEFIDWVGNLKKSLLRNPETRYQLADVASEYLRKWLKAHVLKTDMAYKGKI